MKLFFNYRREDTQDLAGRLYDRLCSEFGAENIFKDVDSIRPGDDWQAVLEKSVQASDVVLALMAAPAADVCE
ncbi:MAG UNVERIFIED_CONTAM: toll/interleukin-1 receptor domain-containing protein [Planctomycetaceae bacterium]